MASAQNIVAEIKKWNITHAVGVPDNGSAKIYECLRVESDIEVITVRHSPSPPGCMSVANDLLSSSRTQAFWHPAMLSAAQL